MTALAHAFAAVSLACWVARLVLLVVLHARPTGYHPVRHAVSDYAVGPTGPLAARLSWVTAVGWLAFACAATLWFPAGGDRLFVVVCSITLGVLGFVMPLVPTVLEGQRLTRRGLLHYVLAIASFALAYAAMGNVVRVLAPAAPAVGGVLGAVSWVALVSLVGVCVTLVGPGRRVFGLVERAYLASVLVFYGLAAAAMAIVPPSV